ncbi:ATP-binding cassette domain-containing protein [Geomesophilobacter sediminis]|uniref:Organic solvent ABC transporter ATP-binding protein n=1 Tax=Geomesophilobacter sediminis TaxID=2798584 RepID=A0A8J7M176_9BACT|nr:ATP-binding cassette domain-containing protein [Geomesophilobacter sediminis]MBJ6726739.1 organic solvent ABC transporter ATP-binding protein [Geomesophilobacter sediminis]
MTSLAAASETAVELKEVPLPGLAPVSFSLKPGEMGLFLTAKEEASALLARLVLGLERHSGGSIVLLDADTAALSYRDWQQLRQRIGFSQGSGGLVSNLKAWENLTLPLYYHRQASHQEVESLGLALLERIGYTARYMELPGHLTLFQKKQVGLARALIMDPELVVYESPEQGINQQEKELFYRLIQEFHRERPGRASLIVSCQPDSVAAFAEARLLAPKGQHA